MNVQNYSLLSDILLTVFRPEFVNQFPVNPNLGRVIASEGDGRLLVTPIDVAVNSRINVTGPVGVLTEIFFIDNIV